ncbi:MAG: hypothetical protein ACLFMZ_07565 [Spirochaetaceae bacterium]
MINFLQYSGKKCGKSIFWGVPILTFFLLLAAVSCTTAPPPPEETEEPEKIEEIEAPPIEDMDIEEDKEPEEEPKPAVEEVEEEEEFLPLDELGEEKKERLTRLLNNMVYLVYTGKEEEKDYREVVLETANDYLAQKHIGYIEYTHIDRMLQESDSLYEKETGGSVSPLRWSAYKFGADVYGEIEVKTNNRRKGDMFYGTAGVAVSLYQTSTGDEWARTVYKSPSAVGSDAGTGEAVERAVQEAVRNALQEGIGKVRTQAIRSLQKGISYTIELRNINNEDIEGDFVKGLENEVESIEKTEELPYKISFRIDFIGDVTELEDAVFRAARDVESLEDMFLVFQRGNTIAFNTGM